MPPSPRTRLLTPVHLLLVGLLCAPIAGCILGLDVGPGVSFDQSVVAEGQALADFARAQGNTAAILVTGQIVGKLPCDLIGIDVDDKGGAIDVTVTIDANKTVCNGVTPTTWSYVANVVNLDAGPTNLKVRYRFIGLEGVDGVRLDTTVTVK